MRTLARAMLCTLWAAAVLPGYSVLTHEAIIDSAWDTSLKPILQKRFPQATADDLKEAHAYAYGGCIIQDMGYYPFGSKLFSDLTHYVRSGDFVVIMLKDAQTLPEYAFALGALAHYASDNEGHPLAVNPAVAEVYPKLREKYGPKVTYAENPTAHIKTEFGFDVLQVARGLYGPQAYHDFIGFKVAKPLLQRAFQDTYGVPLTSIFKDLNLGLGTYRRAVGSVIPEMTKVAWNLKKDEIAKLEPGVTRQKFLYRLNRASYRKEWDDEYQKPGVGAKVLSFVLRIVPKVGPFKAVGFKPPTADTEKMFMASFNHTMDLYQTLLKDVRNNSLHLRNMNFDTGRPVVPGEYTLADNAYAHLAQKLADKPEDLNPEIRSNVLAYFSNLDANFATKKKPKEWQKTVAAVNKLRAVKSPQTAEAPRRGEKPL